MRLLSAISLIALSALPLAAKADTINLSTGTGSLNYAVTGAESGPSQVISSPNGGWSANIPGAEWINVSGSGTASDAAGVYYYTVSFVATSTDTISGAFAADNDATLFINGTSVAGDLYGPPYGFTTVTPFSYEVGPGLVTLVFDVTNGNLADGGTDGAGPTGLLANVEVAATPEPSSLILLGTGLCGAAAAARRRISRR